MSCRIRGLSTVLILLFLYVLSICPVAQAQGPLPAQGEERQTPVLAYYYIWYHPLSWERAKIDYPLLGRYTSDDPEVMARHVQWAKMAGIDGFIVSWKSTDTLNPRLDALAGISAAEGLKLAIIYQGLTFERGPRPIEQVVADLSYFADRYADSDVFNLFGRPLVIWNGSWQYPRDEIARVVGSLQQRLLILAAERDVEGYARVADLVNGNAYYWSSVNPEVYPGYPERLDEMGQAVHSQDGLWIAPAAPGFDARLVGGMRVVERRDGETLRREMVAALQSSPDAIGLISWNEFGENTHIEPSQKYGVRYLDVLADLRGGVAPTGQLLEPLVEPWQLKVRTFPPLEGIGFSLDGREFSSDENGIARIQVDRAGAYPLEILLPNTQSQDYRVDFRRWRPSIFEPHREVEVPSDEPLQAGFEVSYLIDLAFVDVEGRPVDPARVSHVVLQSGDGFRHRLDGDQPQWIRINRVVRRLTGLESLEMGYSVESVFVDGANVVNRSQQRFHPAGDQTWQIELLLYSARFAARDALFGFPIGSGVYLEHPNGKTEYLAFGIDGELRVESLARGIYQAKVAGAHGFSFSTPIVLSRNQTVTLLVVSYIDIAAVVISGASFALALLFIGRPHLTTRRVRAMHLLLAVAIMLLLIGVAGYWSVVS